MGFRVSWFRVPRLKFTGLGFGVWGVLTTGQESHTHRCSECYKQPGCGLASSDSAPYPSTKMLHEFAAAGVSVEENTFEMQPRLSTGFLRACQVAG